MSDNSNNVHFSGIRFICSPYLAIKSNNGKMWAANESYALKMNIIVMIIALNEPPHMMSVQFCGGYSVHWRLFTR